MRYIGAVTLTAGTPIKLTTAFPNEKGRPFNTLIVAQVRTNAGFVYVGTQEMTGEANASLTIPPTSASASPYAMIGVNSVLNALTLDQFSVDGSASEVIHISTLTN